MTYVALKPLSPRKGKIVTLPTHFLNPFQMFWVGVITNAFPTFNCRLAADWLDVWKFGFGRSSKLVGWHRTKANGPKRIGDVVPFDRFVGDRLSFDRNSGTIAVGTAFVSQHNAESDGGGARRDRRRVDACDAKRDEHVRL
jgi:hypothetical protein